MVVIFVLEFSKIQNSNLDFIYKNYSKLIPIIGQFVVGEKEPYEYLIKSIEQFINQEELIDLMRKIIFKNVHTETFLVELFQFIVGGSFNDKKTYNFI